MTKLEKIEEMNGKTLSGDAFRPAGFRLATVTFKDEKRVMIALTFLTGSDDMNYLLEADDAASLYEGLGILIPKAVTANKETN